MAIAATSTVTTPASAAHAAAPARDANGGDFAAMLAGTMNGDAQSAGSADDNTKTPENAAAPDMTPAATPSDPAKDATASDATDDSAGDDIASGNPGDAPRGRTGFDAKAGDGVMGADRGRKTLPVKGGRDDAKDASSDTSDTDATPVVAALQPANPIQTPVAPPQQTEPVPDKGPAKAEDAADSAARVATTPVAVAAAMLAAGDIVKPDAAGDAKPAAGTQKTEGKSSTAGKLADAGKDVARKFADKALTDVLPSKSDGSDPNAKTGGPAPGAHGAKDTSPAAADASDIKPGAQPAQAAAPAQPAQSSQPAAQTAQPAAPQPVAATAAPSQPAAPNAPAQVQIHAAHQAATQPDINALAVNIATRSDGGTRHFDIRLDPAELGRVDVRLSVDDAGKAQAILTVEKPQTLALLQQDSSHLERALKDAGLDLAQSGLSFSLKGQQQQSGSNAGSGGGRGRALAVRAIAAVDQAASNITMNGLAAGDGRLDIRV
ncbi:MAG: flagellar hook-length control protein FliK [Proteobacteria bacterium]|nr:flagellar hook-length control protein FliK [Pseudomonadota bacterium]